MLVYTADCAKWGWKVVIAEEVPILKHPYQLFVTWLVIAKNTCFFVFLSFAFSPER